MTLLQIWLVSRSDLRRYVREIAGLKATHTRRDTRHATPRTSSIRAVLRPLSNRESRPAFHLDLRVRGCRRSATLRATRPARTDQRHLALISSMPPSPQSHSAPVHDPVVSPAPAIHHCRRKQVQIARSVDHQQRDYSPGRTSINACQSDATADTGTANEWRRSMMKAHLLPRTSRVSPMLHCCLPSR